MRRWIEYQRTAQGNPSGGNLGKWSAVILVLMLPAATVRGETVERHHFVAGFDRFFRAGEDVETAGHLLVGELSCTACHASAKDSWQPKRGPVLDGVGSRLQSGWMKQLLADPQQAKPGTTMPHLLHHLPANEKREKIDALVAYMSSLQEPFPEFESTAVNPIAVDFWGKGDLERGRRLYHQIGCVACHAPDDAYDITLTMTSQLDVLVAELESEELEELGLANLAKPVRSVPLGDLSAKYTRQSLAYFLLDPAAIRPAGRMPDLKLNPEEAADLVAYLLDNQPNDVRPAADSSAFELVETGRELFHSLRCVNCHSVPDSGDVSMAAPLADLDFQSPQACTAEPQRRAPQFALDGDQQQSLQHALGWAAEDRKASAAEQVHMRMLQLNCYACHERGGAGGVGPNRRGYFEIAGQADLGDEGRIPPLLDGVGRKLTISWLNKVFSGTGDVRPHMHARMPIYPESSVNELAEQLVQADRGARESVAADPFHDSASLAAAGRKLMDASCVQCHSVRGEYLPGVMGVEIADISGRIEPDWFRDFLLNPIALKPRTRMPTFFPEGRSANQQILDGDVERQIAAIWAYLNDAEQPLPQLIKENRAYDFELVPKEQPIILRTFMEEAGTRAIAVGFPQQVHFAFDAEQVRMAHVWRGRFLDAHGTWFDRFTPPAVPLGTDLLSLSAGSTFAFLQAPDQQWPSTASATFRGYRLDPDGVPTFHYVLGAFEMEDRFEPVETSNSFHLRRHIRVVRQSEPDPKTSQLWFRANSGHQVVEAGPGKSSNETGLTVHVLGEIGRNAVLRTRGQQSEWIIPLNGETEQKIEVTYQW